MAGLRRRPRPSHRPYRPRRPRLLFLFDALVVPAVRSPCDRPLDPARAPPPHRRTSLRQNSNWRKVSVFSV